MSISNLGYKKNSPYKDRKSLTINSNILTTQDMAFPILAVSDLGDSKMLYPNTGEFKFKGNKVKEYKLKKGYQKGGIEEFLMGLSPEEQNSFVDGYESAPDKEEYLLKCGGKYQQGGTVSTRISPITREEYADMYSELHPTTDKVLLNELVGAVNPLFNTVEFLAKKDKTAMDYASLIPGVKAGKLLEKTITGLPASQMKKVARTATALKLLDVADAANITPDKVTPLESDKTHYQEGGMQLQVPKAIANAEVEKGETVLSTEGTLNHVGGKRHSQGGTPVILNAGDRVFTDYLEVPKDIKKHFNYKGKKATFAELSKKYDPQKEFDILNDPNSDKFKIQTAELNLANKMAMLETLYHGQEALKQQENMGRNLTTSYQMGGGYNTQGMDLSDISGRFQKIKGFSGDALQDPTNGRIYKRNSDGLYSLIATAPNNVPGKPNEFDPSIVSFYPGKQIKDPRKPKKVEDQMSTTPTDPPVERQGDLEPLVDTSVEPINRLNTYVQINPRLNGFGQAPVYEPGQEEVPEQYPLPFPPPPKSEGNKPRIKFTVPLKRKNSNVNPNTPNPTVPESQKPFSYKPTFDETPPTEADMSELEGSTFVERTPNIPNEAPSIDSYLDPAKQSKQSWFERNKDKFGINSKLAGTILDIGLTLSDRLNVDNPTLYSHQKQPLFNRFYEFDNKESSRLASQQIQGIQNSNLPEQVKQAQIAEITANSQDNQSKVDFQNAQRYEQKREIDLGKLQSYLDTNIDARISDVDNYRQRKAKVDYLRSKFKSEQKEKVVNSVRNYLDYTQELGVANELSPYFTVNPLTGRTKYKPQSTSALQSNLLDQYGQTENNTQQLPNGASVTRVGDMYVVVDKDGKTTIRQDK